MGLAHMAGRLVLVADRMSQFLLKKVLQTLLESPHDMMADFPPVSDPKKGKMKVVMPLMIWLWKLHIITSATFSSLEESH